MLYPLELLSHHCLVNEVELFKPKPSPIPRLTYLFLVKQMQFPISQIMTPTKAFDHSI